MVMALIIWRYCRYGSERGGKEEGGDGSGGHSSAWWHDNGNGDQGSSLSSTAATSVPLIGHLQEAPKISRCGGRRSWSSLSSHASRLRNSRCTARFLLGLFIEVVQWQFLPLFSCFSHISLLKLSNCVSLEFNGCLAIDDAFPQWESAQTFAIKRQVFSHGSTLTVPDGQPPSQNLAQHASSDHFTLYFCWR